jgi:flagellar protein FliO/FliZ
MRRLSASIIVLLLPAFAAAAEAPPVPDAAGALVRVVLSLVVVVAFILAAGWIARRLQTAGHGRGKRMRCVETLAIGVKERVSLVEVGGVSLVVGIAPGCVRTLHVFESPLPESPAPSGGEAPRGFAQLLSNLRQGRPQ